MTTIRFQVSETGFETGYLALQYLLSTVRFLVRVLALITIRSCTWAADWLQGVTFLSGDSVAVEADVVRGSYHLLASTTASVMLDRRRRETDREGTNLQHRQALFRGRAAEWVAGSGEDDIGRHLEVGMDKANRPCVFYRGAKDGDYCMSDRPRLRSRIEERWVQQVDTDRRLGESDFILSQLTASQGRNLGAPATTISHNQQGPGIYSPNSIAGSPPERTHFNVDSMPQVQRRNVHGACVLFLDQGAGAVGVRANEVAVVEQGKAYQTS